MKTKPLSNEYLTEVKERVDSATPGPWISFVEGRDHFGGDSFIRVTMDDSMEDMYLQGASIADQDFIAHARQDIPMLLGEIERLRQLLTSKGISYE
ncbi:hypothetical protein EG834_19585 [bacterium]|nr:hypothetical protein [bacterium]